MEFINIGTVFETNAQQSPKVTQKYLAQLQGFMTNFGKCLKKREQCFESGFRRFSTSTISTIAFYIS